jgi:peptidoglycan/xylan/chitin deacetylase (PgdA/CDA1 family)
VRAILTYHSIDPTGSAISISEEEFSGHVRWLASGRVRVVSLEELPHIPEETDGVAITFDDGFENFSRCAAPALREHGLPATVFVVTRRVGMTNAWNGRRDAGIPELPLLSWAELGRLHQQCVSLGAHSRTHPRLSGVSGTALEEEIEGSATDLREHLGVRPGTFAYPYGAVSPAAAALVRQGFGLAVTTELRMVERRDQSHLLPRLDMFYYREPGRLERWGTAGFRHHLRLRGGIRRVRGLWPGRS